jgi:hypothetical protein
LTTNRREISVQEGNKAIVRHSFEELSQVNWDILEELVSEDNEQHRTLGVPPGREGSGTSSNPSPITSQTFASMSGK